MEATPMSYPDTTNIYHWSGGVEGIDELPEHEDLNAILKVASKLKDKPRYFKVGDRLYTLEDRVWRQIKEGRCEDG